MSLRRDMLQVARLAPARLGESAGRVAAFLREQVAPEGGFADRAGRSDLYYSVFGIEGLLALREAPAWKGLRAYLAGFGDGAGLDFVHLGCLARCWASVGESEKRQATSDKRKAKREEGRGKGEVERARPRTAVAHGSYEAAALLARLERHRTLDGGYHATPGNPYGSAYGCFLALATYQDAGGTLPDPEGLLRCLSGLRCPDGGYANERELPLGNTPATAAAVTVRRCLGETVEAEVGQWLLARRHAQGGFVAVAGAPLPDLLSTATALHALAQLGVALDELREPGLDFLDSLWTGRGGFYGNWADDMLDCEYTYYGLLALGHLTV